MVAGAVWAAFALKWDRVALVVVAAAVGAGLVVR